MTLGAIFDAKTFVAYDVSVSVLTRACGFRVMIAADGAGQLVQSFEGLLELYSKDFYPAF